MSATTRKNRIEGAGAAISEEMRKKAVIENEKNQAALDLANAQHYLSMATTVDEKYAAKKAISDAQQILNSK